MKIGIYDPYLDTLSGGEKYMLTMAECLLGDNEVDIFWDDMSIVSAARDKLRIDVSKARIVKNIFSEKYSSARRLVESGRYDRIIILSDGSIPTTMAKKTILHFQFPVEWVGAKSLKTKLKFLKIDKVICNSFFTKRFIDKKFGIESDVLYPPCIDANGIKDFTADNFEKKKNIILTVGRYSPLGEGGSVKKLEVMIEAFKKMIDEGLEKWEFCAAVSYLQENKRYVDILEKNVGGYPIKIFRNVDFKELNNLYLSAKIYWHAAGFGANMEKHPEHSEHFGITTVEAMAHGAVPVVIDMGGQPEIVDHAVDGFLWDSVPELSSYTKRIMIDDALRRQMAKLALSKADGFTKESFCENLKRLVY